MLVEAKQAFYNEETGAVQPWRDIEVEDTLGNELVSEGLVEAIAAGGGGGGGNTIVTNATMDYPYFTLDKTYAEINAVVTDGGFAIVYTGDGDEESGIPADTYWLAISVGQVDAEYVVMVQTDNGTMSFSTNTESGYPRMIFD